METKQYIKILKEKTRKPISVAMRGAVIYFLRNHNIPFPIIAECIGCKRRNCYAQYYQTRDLLESGDKIMKQAYEELEQHKIRVRPCVIDADNIFSQHAGYSMIIDNVIY